MNARARITGPRALLVAAGLLLAAAPAAAQRIRLDDSPSPVDSLHVDLGWEADALLLSSSGSLSGAAPPATGRLPGVEVRLDTRDFVGQPGRIFVSLRDVAESVDLTLAWEAGGRFIAGSIRPGQSALVFEGPIEQAITIAVFSFVVELGDGSVPPPNSMELVYEFEALP